MFSTDTPSIAPRTDRGIAARAEAVRDYLIAGGIDAGRLTANGYGETEHIAPNDTPAGREQNRRVTLRIAP